MHVKRYNICNILFREPRLDCPPDLNELGELKGAIVLVSNLFGKEGSAHIIVNALSFTAVALVEILSRWKWHGKLCVCIY